MGILSCLHRKQHILHNSSFVIRAAFSRRLASTTSSSRKRQKTYGRGGTLGKDNDIFTADEDNHGVNLASPHPSPQPSPSPAPQGASPSTPRHLPPHIQDEIEEASAARHSAFSRESAPLFSRERSGSLVGASLPGGAMPTSLPSSEEAASHQDVSEQTDQPSSPPSMSEEVRRLGLGRSSSPAKRSLSQREEDDDGYDTIPRSPPGPEHTSTKLSLSQHVSPMPSRIKPIDRRSETRRAPSVDMLADDTLVSTAGPSLSTSPDDSSGTAQGSSPATSTGIEAGQQLPSFDEQVRKVKSMVEIFNRSQVDGQEGFLISCSWLARVLSRTSEGITSGFDKAVLEGDVGPIDNRDLLPSATQSDLSGLQDLNGRSFIPIKPGMTVGSEFEILPDEAWTLVVGWYGVAQDSPTITRYLHNTAADSGSENLLFELYPPIFTLQKIGDERDDQASAAAQLVASRSANFQNFLARAKQMAGLQGKVRVWKVIETLATDSGATSGLATPVASRDTSPARQPVPVLPKLSVDLAKLTSLIEGRDRELVDVKDETNNPKYNGSLKLGALGFMEKQTLILEEAIRTAEKESFASDRGRTKARVAKSDILSAKDTSRSGLSDGRRSPTPGMMTRGRTAKKFRGKACVGLVNLGNTCYMNSALQCIRSIEELTMFFQADAYKADLNPSNPLGHGGSMAKAYAGLMAQFYETNNSFSPRNFRTSVGRSQPLFSGYGQQDSQEFVSFLIDALHEDLNRIQKKPYIENPDSDDALVHDEDYIRQLGETYRSNHAKRNASVAMDLFTGFYKNTMVCPECDKVSVTFDPYAQVTLQIPVENSLQHELLFAPLNGPPVIVDLDIDFNSSIKQVKEYVANRIPDLDARCLIMAEEYNHKIYKIFDDREVLSEARIAEKDILWVFELDVPPTNIPKHKPHNAFDHSNSFGNAQDMSSDAASFMAVPILHKCDSGLTMSPTFIMLTRDEAQDEDKILRKLLQRVQTLTTRDLCENDGDVLASEGKEEHDAIMTNEEDASSDDPNVQARSIEGEDDVVDVQMKENQKISDGNIASRFLDPDFVISDKLDQLFDVRFIKAIGSGIAINVPSSGSMPRDADSLRQRLSKRQPPVERGSSSAKDVTSWTENPLEDGDGSEDELTANNGRSNSDMSATTVQVDSSDEDEAVPPPIPVRAQTVNSRSIPTDRHDPYLVHLGECIILDWNNDAYEGLFRGKRLDDLRGLYTNQSGLTERVPDPALEEKRQRISQRKKQGVSLQECFAETARSEILSEDNAWYCNRCKEMRRATKTLVLWTVPDILIVHLKRFNMQSRWRDKIDVKVDFPIEGLDLNGMVGLPEDKSLVYDLFAVDRHFGGLGGGHYTAVTKNFIDGNWYDYNDSSVSRVSPQVAVDRSAYLLFYKRRTDGPVGPAYLQELVEAAGEPSTRSSSESGEGQRLGEPSSPSGSSSGSRAAAAILPPRQSVGNRALGAAGGNARATPAKNANPTALHHDLLPAYGEDEAISMDDADHPLPSAEIGGAGLQGYGNTYASSGWSFSRLDGRGEHHLASTHAGLDAPANSDDDDETLGRDDSNSLGAGSGSPPGDRMRQFDDDDDDDGEGDGDFDGRDLDMDLGGASHHQMTPESDDDDSNSNGLPHVEHVAYKLRGAAAAAATSAAPSSSPPSPSSAVHDIHVDPARRAGSDES